MRAVLLVLLAGCPDRRAARLEDELALPVVAHERARAAVASDGDHLAIDVDGAIWRGIRRVTADELARPYDPAFVPEPCTYAEPRCMRAPLATFDDDGRLVAGRRGRQNGARRIVGEVVGPDVLRASALVFAARDAAARPLIDERGGRGRVEVGGGEGAAETARASRRTIEVVHGTGAAIVVDGGAALGLDFHDSDGTVQPARQVATLRLDATTDVLRALEASPHAMPCGDDEVILPVHLLVMDGVIVQQLVDAIVTLDLAGVRMIGLGNA